MTVTRWDETTDYTNTTDHTIPVFIRVIRAIRGFQRFSGSVWCDENDRRARRKHIMIGRPQRNRVFFLDDIAGRKQVGVHQAVPALAAGYQRQLEALPFPVGVEHDVKVWRGPAPVQLKRQGPLLPRPVRVAGLGALEDPRGAEVPSAAPFFTGRETYS